jgi:hypothetical protein
MAQPNCNDQIAARAFGATEHVSPTSFDRLRQFDAVFATMWKVCTREFEPRWMDVLHRLKDETDVKVVLFQEAETAWPTTRPWDEQKSFIELLGKVDLFLTHNHRDIEFWGRLRGGKSTSRWKTCLDIGSIAQYAINPDRKTTKPILFGSSYDQRANGLAGLIACRNLGYPLWHQNRSTGYEDRNREVPQLLGVKIQKEIPHCGWDPWAREIAGAYIAVHPMPAAAAGRDQIAFAALGIPCIGNMELDIQRELFPNLSIDIFDVNQIEQKAKYIINNSYIDYEFERNHAMRRVNSYGLAAAADQAWTLKEWMQWQ